MKKVYVYTGQLYIKPEIEKVCGVIYDTTVKTGIRELAPAWWFLKEYKDSAKTHDDVRKYIERYYEKLIHASIYSTDILDEILSHERIVLCCYCHCDSFCHRHILLQELAKYASTQGIRVTYLGEIVRGGDIRKTTGLVEFTAYAN